MDPQLEKKQHRLKIMQRIILMISVAGVLANVWIIHLNSDLMKRLKVAVAQAEGQKPKDLDGDLSQYSLLHMPASGKCPDGFEAIRDIFERDGRRYPGCSRIGGDPNSGMIDRIGPGESVGIAIPLELPRRPDTPSVRQ